MGFYIKWKNLELYDATETELEKDRNMEDGSLLLDVYLSQQEQWRAVDSYGIWLAGCISLSRQIDGWNGGEESPQAWWLKLDKTRLLSLVSHRKRLRVLGLQRQNYS